MITPPSAPKADFSFLRQLIFEYSRNVLDPSRDYLFETRLARLMRQEGLKNLVELVDRLRTRRESEFARAVAEAMTINETSFFRDIRPFELLRTELLPKLIEARRQTRALSLWSAACSTGQEAYSLAMLVREHFPALNDWTIRIEGTDISSEVVTRAQQGIYHRIEVNRGLPARTLVRFFDQTGEDWTIRPEIRQMCRFRVANLCGPQLPFPVHERFDIIFLRNVMLYFSRETRHQLLANIHRQLAPDGYLFLGSSEQPADPSIWTTVLSGGICHYLPRQGGESLPNRIESCLQENSFSAIKSAAQTYPTQATTTSAPKPVPATEWRKSQP